MPTNPVQATAKGMSNLNRRLFLRGAAVASVAVLATTGATVAGSSQISAELEILIRDHRVAFDAIGAQSAELAEAETVFYCDRSNDSVGRARDAALAVQGEILRAESDALVALLSYPFRNLTELRAVLTIAKEAWWDHDCPADSEFDALLAGIMGGAGA